MGTSLPGTDYALPHKAAPGFGARRAKYRCSLRNILRKFEIRFSGFRSSQLPFLSAYRRADLSAVQSTSRIEQFYSHCERAR